MGRWIDHARSWNSDLPGDVREWNIEYLELTVREHNCFKNDGIRTLGDLLFHTEEYLLSIPNFGKVSLNHIKDLLAEEGLSLGDRPSDLKISWIIAKRAARLAIGRHWARQSKIADDYVRTRMESMVLGRHWARQ